ncbi:hypothetical protein AVEN_124976-1 [Araneus ventricosus]|uniref:Uncharacterized protein n=1 Tax=Araneus ventricosus TaxID=182803 RepID=A0A4Y2VMP2_ARAVE|nr:hypothetical protein AVEN_124976-1 [Araneus ventricosus]
MYEILLLNYNYMYHSSTQHSTIPQNGRPLWASGKVMALGAEGFEVRNSPLKIPLKISLAWGMLHAKSYVVAKRSPVGVAWKFGKEASYSSSDRG